MTKLKALLILSTVSSTVGLSLVSGDMASAGATTSDNIEIVSLHRYAVKGLNFDALPAVEFPERGATFPDDRRFALLWDDGRDFQPREWMHKENFLCAFTAPQLLSRLESSYEIIADESQESTERRLIIRDRKSQKVLLPPTDLSNEGGRRALASFLSDYSGRKVQCVTNCPPSLKVHNFQFGNTSSGVKKNQGDTRTIHIINQNTIDDVQSKLQLDLLHATRFRPNIVLRGPPAWSEFEWVNDQRELQVVHSNNPTTNPLRLRMIQRTVRCDGVSVDPLDPETILDIPQLLAKHFPEHGPYLGVYATVENPGSLSVGNQLQLV